MISSDFRKEAREKLTGKWGKIALITLIYMVIAIILNYFDNHTDGFANLIISIFTIVINVPIIYGLTMTFFKLFNDENVEFFDFLKDGFNNFSRSWNVAWSVFVKLLAPFILLIVSYILMAIGGAGSFIAYFNNSSTTASGALLGLAVIGVILAIVSYVWLLVKSYYYQLTSLIAIENPEMSSKDAVEESKKLMEGKRWKLFCLQFSFIGWAILAALTLGIGMLWLTPYIEFAVISFYKHTLGNKETVIEEPVQTNE